MSTAVKPAYRTASTFCLSDAAIASVALQDVGRHNIKARSKYAEYPDFGFYDEPLLLAANKLAKQVGFSEPYPGVKQPRRTRLNAQEGRKEKFGFAWLDDVLLCEL